ncbi:GntR family transcriptional regulator [Paucibacter sp. APW11]|uniref:GntR family transcriptional regulator n=2 Tax=Roseateles aquae TaxID=3077235 RepID=A0ABU3P8F5_9BURK|nr:GntR family transcriptional regulator [Paucibacter sp. APW11]MDT8998862.1 GntR family transcriptional regulator [Paucibacter sp. APW11]
MPERGDGAGAPSFSPLYRQIKGLIITRLQAGEWKAGESIPSEMELAQRFGVSQGTVRKAVDELAAENLLVRRQGKGTFVATHAEQQQQYRFLRLMPDEGQEAGLGRQLLDCRRQRAPAWIAKALQMRSGDAMVEVRRLLHSKGRPVVLDDIWLPGQLFKGLTTERLNQHRGPFYGLFETEFGVQMIRAQEKIRAVLADAETAALLQVEIGAPLLSVERLSFTYGDKPVELRRGLYNTSTHFYRNDLN